MKGLAKALAVAVKEMRQIRRDRRTLLILLFVPAFFLLVYGYALNFDLRNIRMAVLDQDRSVVSRELVSAFVYSGYFDVVANVQRTGDIDALLDRNEVRAVLVIPAKVGVHLNRRTSGGGMGPGLRRDDRRLLWR